jgi:hypothetical protein
MSDSWFARSISEWEGGRESGICLGPPVAVSQPTHLRSNDVPQVAPQITRKLLSRHVHQAPDFGGADRVEQDGRWLGKDDVPMVGVWQGGAVQQESNEEGRVVNLQAQSQRRALKFVSWSTGKGY